MAAFGETPQGAEMIRAWEWLHWSYSRAVPHKIDELRVLSRRHLRG
jgi:hypothetical protein